MKRNLFYIIVINIIVFVVFNIYVYVTLVEDSRKNIEMQKIVASLNITNNSEVAVIYDGGSALVWSWLLPKVDRLYFLRKDSNDPLLIDKWDLVIYPIDKSRERMFETQGFSHRVVGNYDVYAKNK